MKFIKKVYRLTVWSQYEEDGDEPYYVDFDTKHEAFKQRYSYESELTMSGSRAYSVCGPDLVDVELEIDIEFVEQILNDLKKAGITNFEGIEFIRWCKSNDFKPYNIWNEINQYKSIKKYLKED